MNERESNITFDRADVWALRKLGACALAIALIASIAVVYVFHGGMKKNALRLPFERGVNAVLWAPEGWRFFTRDAREERTSMYVRRSDGWQSAALSPNARAENAFGLDRRGRAQGVELGLLTEGIPATAWQRCEGSDPLACLERAEAPGRVRLRNVSPYPSLCGEVGLVSQKPIPWAWASQGLHPTMPIAIVRLEVSC
jgi:antimicrobial peptide system SdpA family protein